MVLNLHLTLDQKKKIHISVEFYCKVNPAWSECFKMINS